MKSFDRLYSGLARNLWWYYYVPSDERERTIYLEAYERTFWAAFFLNMLLFTILVTANYIGLKFVDVQLTAYQYIYIELAIFLSATIAGSSRFWNEDIHMRGDQSSYIVRVSLVMMFIVLLVLLLIKIASS